MFPENIEMDAKAQICREKATEPEIQVFLELS